MQMSSKSGCGKGCRRTPETHVIKARAQACPVRSGNWTNLALVEESPPLSLDTLKPIVASAADILLQSRARREISNSRKRVL